MNLDPTLPLTVVLGAGGARGVAHIGVLEALAERGFRVTEIVGSSVGALIAAFYAAVGLDLPAMRQLGLEMTSQHLLSWAWLRRAPEWLRRRFLHRAGIIPEYVARLERTQAEALHHGVERIGLLTYDLISREEALFHNEMDEFPLCDATRGAVAIPNFYPPRDCVIAGRRRRLIDGGVFNRVPLEWALRPPFAPRQILVADISNTLAHRAENAAKVERLVRMHPHIAICAVRPDTIGKGTVLYRQGDLRRLIDSGRRVAERALT
jgi:NTE family protein